MTKEPQAETLNAVVQKLGAALTMYVDLIEPELAEADRDIMNDFVCAVIDAQAAARGYPPPSAANDNAGAA